MAISFSHGTFTSADDRCRPPAPSATYNKAIILLENNIRNKSRGLWVVNQPSPTFHRIQQNVTQVMAKCGHLSSGSHFGWKISSSISWWHVQTSTHPLPFLLSFAFRFIAFQRIFGPFIKSTSTARGFPYHFVVLGLKCWSFSSCVLGLRHRSIYSEQVATQLKSARVLRRRKRMPSISLQLPVDCCDDDNHLIRLSNSIKYVERSRPSDGNPHISDRPAIRHLKPSPVKQIYSHLAAIVQLEVPIGSTVHAPKSNLSRWCHLS